MTSADPYNAPPSDASLAGPGVPKVSRLFWLPGFLTSIAFIPLTFVVFGFASDSGDPDFMADPGFIATVVVCSLGAALALYPLRLSSMILRALVTPVLAFVFFCIAVVLMYKMFS